MRPRRQSRRARQAVRAAAGADLREHLVALALLVGETALTEPRAGRGRTGRDGVAADAVLRVQIGEEARKRQHRGLRHRVVWHPGRRALGCGRGNIDDRGALRRPQVRECGADRAHIAHHVQLPVGVPLLVRDLLEPGLPRDADVVDEDVEAAERLRRLLHRRARARPPAPRSAWTWSPPRCPGASVRPQVTTRAPSSSSSRARGQADAVGRAGHEAGAVAKAEIHGR